MSKLKDKIEALEKEKEEQMKQEQMKQEQMKQVWIIEQSYNFHFDSSWILLQMVNLRFLGHKNASPNLKFVICPKKIFGNYEEQLLTDQQVTGYRILYYV